MKFFKYIHKQGEKYCTQFTIAYFPHTSQCITLVLAGNCGSSVNFCDFQVYANPFTWIPLYDKYWTSSIFDCFVVATIWEINKLLREKILQQFHKYTLYTNFWFS